LPDLQEWIKFYGGYHNIPRGVASGGAGAISPSIPPCSSEPPFNELCN
jgi:hypothetical protein